jgi:hypothetical protein
MGSSLGDARGSGAVGGTGGGGKGGGEVRAVLRQTQADVARASRESIAAKLVALGCERSGSKVYIPATLVRLVMDRYWWPADLNGFHYDVERGDWIDSAWGVAAAVRSYVEREMQHDAAKARIGGT